MIAYIKIRSCDASTYVKMDVTPDEMVFLERLSIATRTRSAYMCEPDIKLEKEGDIVFDPADYE